jgi:hypothetical protein
MKKYLIDKVFYSTEEQMNSSYSNWYEAWLRYF